MIHKQPNHPQAAKPVFEAELPLLNSVALSVTWFLEFLTRLTRKGEKKKLKQMSFNGTAYDPKACSSQCCNGVALTPILSQISENISNNECNGTNPYCDKIFCLHELFSSVLYFSHISSQIQIMFCIESKEKLTVKISVLEASEVVKLSLAELLAQ